MSSQYENFDELFRRLAPATDGHLWRIMQGRDGLSDGDRDNIFQQGMRIIIQSFISETSPYTKFFGNYERPEYVGDTILRAIIAEMIFDMYPQDQPQQLTEANAFLGSAKQQAVMFDNMGLEAIYLLMEDSELMTKRRGRIPTTVKSDIIEALFFNIHRAVDKVVNGGGYIVCYNIIASYLPRRISPYRKNGGWRSMLNQTLGKNMGGKSDGVQRYPITEEKGADGMLKGTITLSQSAIDDISKNAHDNRLEGLKPYRATYESDHKDDLYDTLYLGLFSHIISHVGYHWLQNYRRNRMMLQLIRDNNITDFFATNNIYPFAKIARKSSGMGISVVQVSYNSLYPNPPRTVEQVMDSIRNEFSAFPPEEQDDIFKSRDADPNFDRNTVTYYLDDGDDRAVTTAALIKFYRDSLPRGV